MKKVIIILAAAAHISCSGQTNQNNIVQKSTEFGTDTLFVDLHILYLNAPPIKAYEIRNYTLLNCYGTKQKVDIAIIDDLYQVMNMEKDTVDMGTGRERDFFDYQFTLRKGNNIKVWYISPTINNNNNDRYPVVFNRLIELYRKIIEINNQKNQ
jgi:hypothetical protein